MRSKDPELMGQIRDCVNRYYRTYHRAPTQREVARDLSISSATAHRYLVTMGEIGMIDYDSGVSGTSQIHKCSEGSCYLPVVGSIQCGDPEEEEEEVEQYVSLPVSIFGRGDYYLLHAEGRSMMDAGIAPGDLVVIEKKNFAKEGDIVVALDDYNQNTLKRYAGVDQESGKVVLLFENAAEYPDSVIMVNQLVVQGVAKFVIKALSSSSYVVL